MSAPSYFEHTGGYRQIIRESDVVEWPPIVVTESELPEPEIPLIEDGERHAEGTK